MEAKITGSDTQGIQPVVTIGFFDEGKEVFSKKYFLDPGQTIDDIKPQIKDDLNRIEESVRRAKENREKVGEVVDLKDVKSASELREEKVDESPAE